MQLRVGWRWLALAFFLPAAFMALAAAADVALDGSLPPSPAAGHILLAGANFFLVFLVGGTLGEEFGWRGYALPAVQSHLPMGLYALSAIASAVLLAWLFNRTKGSVLPVLVLHTVESAWSSVFPVMVLPDRSNLRPFQMVVGILVFVALPLLFRRDTAQQVRLAAPHFRP